MDEWEYRIAELKWRIEKLRQETGYYNKSSHSQPEVQKSVEEPKEDPQKTAKNAEMDALKAKLLGRMK